eukprot:SAG11_NODE_980_length_6319_cov_2.389068_4_plen_408_part_00
MRSLAAADASVSFAALRLSFRAREFGAFLGRFQIDAGPAIHLSAGCTVVFAKDAKRHNVRRALKLMRNLNQFIAEITSRRYGPNSEQIPADVVIRLVSWHTPAGEAFADAVGQREEAEPTRSSVGGQTHPQFDEYPYVLVLECAERSLHDACAKERIAGYNLSAVRGAAGCVVWCVLQLHKRRICHGDLKQRNVVRLGGGWVMCDMDASGPFGAMIGYKTSTAYAPPELARVRFTDGGSVAASPSFDAWSLGVLLFELCSGRTLFRQDTANDELIDEADKTLLCTWHTISDKLLEDVFAAPEAEVPEQVVADAKQLIRWCLKGEPAARPTMAQIMAHRFFVESAPPPCVLPMRYFAFMSYAQADAKLGVSTWLDMRQAKLTLEGMRQVRLSQPPQRARESVLLAHRE